jgi:hypothetical protein
MQHNVQHGSDVAGAVGVQHAKGGSLRRRYDYWNGTDETWKWKKLKRRKGNLENPLCFPPVRMWADLPRRVNRGGCSSVQLLLPLRGAEKASQWPGSAHASGARAPWNKQDTDHPSGCAFRGASALCTCSHMTAWWNGMWRRLRSIWGRSFRRTRQIGTVRLSIFLLDYRASSNEITGPTPPAWRSRGCYVCPVTYCSVLPQTRSSLRRSTTWHPSLCP